LITQSNGTVFGGPANRNGFSLDGHPILRALPVDGSSGPSRSSSFNALGVETFWAKFGIFRMIL